MRSINFRWKAVFGVLILALAGTGCQRPKERPAEAIPKVEHGVRLVQSVVAPADWDSETHMGEWCLFELQFRSEVRVSSAVLSVSGNRARRWTTTVALQPGRSAVASIVLESGPRLTYELSDRGRVLAAGPLNTIGTGPATFTLPDSNTRVILIGQRPEAMPTERMCQFVTHPELLQTTRAIFISAQQDFNRWLNIPGINLWLRAGGLLIHETRGPERWKAVGAGAIVECLGGLSADHLSRMVTMVRNSPAARLDGEGLPHMHSGLFPQAGAPVAALAGTVMLFVLVALPVNYLALRRLRRKEAAWITIPILSAIVTIVVAGICLSYKGAGTVVARTCIIHQDSPGVFLGEGTITVFAPTLRRYNINFPSGEIPNDPTTDRQGPGMRSVLRYPVEIAEGGTTVVRNFAVPQWWSRSLTYHFAPPIQGAISGSASVDRMGHWSADVFNGTTIPLEDATVWVGNHYLPLGRIAAEHTVMLRSRSLLNRGDHHSDLAPTLQDRWRHAALEEWIKGASRGVYLVAWTGSHLQNPTVEGATMYEDQAMLVAPLEMKAGPDGLVAPPNSLTMLSTGGSDAGQLAGSTLGSGSYPGMMPGGATNGDTSTVTATADQSGPAGAEHQNIIAIHLPADIFYQPDSTLQLSLSRDTSESGALLAWNPHADRWDQVDQWKAVDDSLPSPNSEASNCLVQIRSLNRYVSYPPGPPGHTPNPVVLLERTGDGSATINEVSLEPTSRHHASGRSSKPLRGTSQ